MGTATALVLPVLAGPAVAAPARGTTASAVARWPYAAPGDNLSLLLGQDSNRAVPPQVPVCGGSAVKDTLAKLGMKALITPEPSNLFCQFRVLAPDGASNRSVGAVTAMASSSSSLAGFQKLPGVQVVRGVGSYALYREGEGAHADLVAVNGPAGVSVNVFEPTAAGRRRIAIALGNAMLAVEAPLHLPTVPYPGIIRPPAGYQPAPGNPTGSVRVAATDICGQPVPQVALELRRAKAGDVWTQLVSGATGPTVFSQVPAGVYVTRLAWPNGMLWETPPKDWVTAGQLTVVAGQTAVWKPAEPNAFCTLPDPRLPLGQQVTITGLVTDTAGQPVPGAQLVFWRTNVFPSLGADNSVTGKDGRYRVVRPVGDRSLDLIPDAPGYTTTGWVPTRQLDLPGGTVSVQDFAGYFIRR